jgi:hypothetical protein
MIIKKVKLPKKLTSSINNYHTAQLKLKKLSLKEKVWLNSETKHFIYFISSEVKIDKKDFQKSENHLKFFCKTFNFKFDKKIYFICVGNRREMKKILGRKTNGTAKIIKNQGIVFSVFLYHPHEVVHIIMNKLGKSKLLFNEGVATLFGWDDEMFHKVKINTYSKKVYNISLAKMMSNKYFSTIRQKNSYPYSALFVKFIINKIGISEFKKIYKKMKEKNLPSKNIKILEKILEKKFSEIEKEFKIFLSQLV